MSRRAAKPVKDRLADLRAAREAGGRSKQWKSTEDEELYDEVSEDDYKKIVKNRLDRDDFIVDDDGGGYVDNGMDAFEAEKDYESDDNEEDEEERESAKHQSTAERKKTKAALAAQRAKDEAYAEKNSITDYRPVVSTEKEQDFMSSLLGNLDSLPSKSAAPSKRSSPRVWRTPTAVQTSRNSKASEAPSSDLPSDAGYGQFSDANDASENEWSTASPTKKPKREPSSSPTHRLSSLAVDDGDEYDDGDAGFWEEAAEMDLDEPEVGKGKAKVVKPQNVLPNGRAVKVEPKVEPVDTKPPAWLELHASLNASAVTEPETLGSDKPGTISHDVKALEEDGSLRMFWLDYLELDSRLYLVGKVIDKAQSTEKVTKWASCCVAIEGIERNLFVLPRKYRMEFGHETDTAPTEDEVYDEFDRVRQKNGIKKWAAKFVTRSYAFGEPVSQRANLNG
ncbi:DNA polymerase II large subunit [Rhizoctonia solani]|uniref:DNA polymerase II large subunit n=1 Tax=Rhizoctonia solani TaxID=456999 RepID=A0A8H8NRS5_9AGAM|nr:DNA polymerase II large subunit [Rhizoctonia solani]QRW17153.1 DNA polymerase II large subunit [Rhizoctonia solani]